MYHRRKIILALLNLIKEPISLIQMQKFLFLFTRMEQEKKTFDFVPYLYGCYSYQANQDIITLNNYGLVQLEGHNATSKLKLSHDKTTPVDLDLFEYNAINNIVLQYGKMSEDQLLYYIYTKYPYYAINSIRASYLLSAEEMAIVNKQKRSYKEEMLFSIGYEGLSLESYLNKLILNDVHVLCDVRKNAYSQKYGFSKHQLANACQGLHIEYIHIPSLGIDSSMRSDLNSQTDYDILFDKYEKNILPLRNDDIDFILNLIKQKGRVALTCFEKDPKQCHRTRIINKILSKSTIPFKLLS